MAPPDDASPTPPFWAGYRAWLGEHRRVVLGVLLLELALLVLLLVLTRTPEDPFAYQNF